MKQYAKVALTENSSPWGQIDIRQELAPGIIAVSTPSHGGFWLSPERWQDLMAAYDEFNCTAPQWLEEDCEVALAVLLWPTEFSPGLVNGCVGMVEGWWGVEYVPEIRLWLASSAGRVAREIAEAWNIANASNWQAGTMSCGPNDPGWIVHLQRIGDKSKQVRCFPEYPTLPVYTDEELERFSIPAPARKPQPKPAPVPAHHIAPHFNEVDCSGVFGADGMVYSDADPGL